MSIIEAPPPHTPRRRNSVKEQVYHLLEGDLRGSPLHIAINLFLVSLILLNVLAFILTTVEPFRTQHGLLLRRFEIFSVFVFSVEYILRAWSCTAAPEYRGVVHGRFRYLITPLAIIDLVAVLPFYLGFLPIDMRFVRVVRTYRLMRLAKLARYSSALRMIVRVVDSKREELGVSLMCMLFTLLVAASLMYFAEHQAQPTEFSSIPAAMWWAVITLTTIGYGDIYPVTPFGKFLASGIALLGVGTIALPAGILGAAFMEEIDRSRRGPTTCPHCGKPIERRGLVDHGPPTSSDRYRRGESGGAAAEHDPRERRQEADFDAHHDDWPSS